MTILIVILSIFGVIFALWIYDILTRKEFIQEAAVMEKSTVLGFREVAFLPEARLSDTMALEDSYFLKLQFKDGRISGLRVNENFYRAVFVGQRFSVKCTKGILGLRMKGLGEEVR